MVAFAEHPLGWAEEHPYVSAAVIVGGVAVIYWLFFSGSGNSSANAAAAGQANMAAAYYAAEAQQAVAGTQLNIAQDANLTAVKTQQIQADAAVSINASNNQAQTTLAKYWSDSANVQANDTAATAAAHDAYNAQVALAGYQAGLATTAMQTIMPQEIALSGGYGAFAIPGMGTAAINTQGNYNPSVLAAQGYTQTQINQMMGLGA